MNTSIIEIDSTKCFECGNESHEQHHVIPKSRGGKKTIPICSTCHGKVHNIKRSDNHSRLTKEALQKAKKRGVKLGKPENFKYEHRLMGAEAMIEKAKSNHNNKKALPIIVHKREVEKLSYGKIADYLNDNDYLTANNKQFSDTTVMRIYKKLHLNKI